MCLVCSKTFFCKSLFALHTRSCYGTFAHPNFNGDSNMLEPFSKQSKNSGSTETLSDCFSFGKNYYSLCLSALHNVDCGLVTVSLNKLKLDDPAVIDHDSTIIDSPQAIVLARNKRNSKAACSCWICGKNFLSKSLYKLHILSCNQSHCCVKCRKSFSTAGNLKRHMKMHKN